MNTSKKYQEQEINWDELAVMGINKKFLQEQGQLEKLLSGQATDYLPFELILLGVPVRMDASLRLITEPDGDIQIEIQGVKFNSESNGKHQ